MNKKLLIIFIFIISIYGCISNNNLTTPFRPENTKTPNINITLSPTNTLPSTLSPDLADRYIADTFRENNKCQLPCFWGIIPSQTTIKEATNIFYHLGLEIKKATIEGREIYGVGYRFGNGLSSVSFTVENEIVKNLSANILPTAEKVGHEEWMAYSPETLIRQYGKPSKVGFFVDRAAPTPYHSMIMYFEEIDLIIEYSGTSIIEDMATLKICPLTNKVDSIRIWIGKTPEYPPSFAGISFEEATSLDLEKFNELMMTNPKEACFNLNSELFP